MVETANEAAKRMKWIVGLDLHPSGVGALRFGGWLARTSSAGDELLGLHVLEAEYLRAALRYHHLDELIAGATAAAAEATKQAGADTELRQIDILQGSTPSKSLVEAHTEHRADGLLIGRQAKKDGRELVRLGRVARRVLRALPGPTIVVPPDYTPSDEVTPVIASCSMCDDCMASVGFARDMAARLGAPLILAHVVPTPGDYGAHYLPEASRAKMKADHHTEGLAALRTWADEVGCGDAQIELLQGGIVDELVALCRTRDAAMLVSGSRRLSGFERVLLTSIGTELAAAAPCPVAIVPPPA